MLFGFIRQKRMATENKDPGGLERIIDQTWDLSGAAPMNIPGFDAGILKVFDLMFRKLNHTMIAILKSVVVLASLGPGLFKISRAFKSKSRVQKEQINGISRAGIRISQGIQEISVHAHTLTRDFTGMQKEVATALEKEDQSISGFREIKDQVVILVETIQILKENSDSIGSIIDLLNHISDETNILSLNARIEAVRGQSDGKGFKVIAEEVGTLAKQSKEATLDIQRRLTLLGKNISRTVGAVEQVEDNVNACEQQINDAHTSLNQVCHRFGALSDNLEEINEATGRQTEDVSQVSQNIIEIESALEEQVRDTDTIFDIAAQVNAACDQMIVDTGVFHLSGHHRARQVAEKMAEDAKICLGSRPDREKALSDWLARKAFIELAYITDARGRQTTSNIYSPGMANHKAPDACLGQDWSAKEWFQTPAQTHQHFISKVYRSSATQSFCFTVAVPLFDQGRFSGVLGIDINFQDMLGI